MILITGLVKRSMILKKPYENIEETMIYLKRQIIDSLSFAAQYVPEQVNDARGLWNFLKPRLTFVDDPKGTELLQSFETLMWGSRTGVSGGGDCDCFVIGATASANIIPIACKIVLAGRERKAPVHIYNLMYYNNSWVPFDLTEPLFGMKRDYLFYQIINANLDF